MHHLTYLKSSSTPLAAAAAAPACAVLYQLGLIQLLALAMAKKKGRLKVH